MKAGNREFLNHTYVMGILNVTPDSFSDGGKWNCIDGALRRTEQMIDEGAAVIDIGGESTRPNYTKISDAEEIERTSPIIEEIKKRFDIPVSIDTYKSAVAREALLKGADLVNDIWGFTKISDAEEIERTSPIIEEIKKRFDIPVSIDTYKSAVAREALLKGADLVNDIWGFKYDINMAKTVKEFDAACCLMHNRKEAVYGDFMGDVLDDLKESIQIAKSAGISDNKIMTDPGIGFAKTLEQNLYLTSRAEELKKLGYPVLLGTSRKSMIGLTLDLPVTERLEGTLATTVMAVIKGCLFVRVHDVKENVRAVRMTEALLNS